VPKEVINWKYEAKSRRKKYENWWSFQGKTVTAKRSLKVEVEVWIIWRKENCVYVWKSGKIRFKSKKIGWGNEKIVCWEGRKLSISN
jgi:hypothetical protein